MKLKQVQRKKNVKTIKIEVLFRDLLTLTLYLLETFIFSKHHFFYLKLEFYYRVLLYHYCVNPTLHHNCCNIFQSNDRVWNVEFVSVTFNCLANKKHRQVQARTSYRPPIDSSWRTCHSPFIRKQTHTTHTHTHAHTYLNDKLVRTQIHYEQLERKEIIYFQNHTMQSITICIVMLIVGL